MKKPARPGRKKPPFTAAQLRIIDQRIDAAVSERVSRKMAGLKATFAWRPGRRGGCG